MQDYLLRVYYEDTDAQGVVYYANYLKFFERARTEFLREVGYEQMKLMQEKVIFVVRGLELKLLKPARLCLLYTSPSPRDRSLSRMPSSA